MTTLAATNMHEVSLDQLSLARFSEVLGTRFRVFAGQTAAPDLTLLEANSSRPVRGGTQAECYSLVFTGPAERQLSQQIYRFEHDQLGAFELFIVPVGRNGALVQYEAVINRRHR